MRGIIICAAVVLVAAPACGSGAGAAAVSGSSRSGRSQGGVTSGPITEQSTPGFLPVDVVLQKVNDQLPGMLFSVAKKFDIGTNLIPAGSTYGRFILFVAKPGHPVARFTWGKDRIPFTRHLRAGNFWTTHGLHGGLCDVVKRYPGNVGMVWQQKTPHDSCAGVRPRGAKWAKVDLVLSHLG